MVHEDHDVRVNVTQGVKVERKETKRDPRFQYFGDPRSERASEALRPRNRGPDPRFGAISGGTPPMVPEFAKNT